MHADFDIALFDCELRLVLLELDLKGTASPAPARPIEEPPPVSSLDLGP